MAEDKKISSFEPLGTVSSLGPAATAPALLEPLEASMLLPPIAEIGPTALSALDAHWRKQLQIMATASDVCVPYWQGRLGEEWQYGRDYELVDDRPLNMRPDGSTQGCNSLIYRIRTRDGHVAILKMCVNFHGGTTNLSRFHAEGTITATLGPHPNIIRLHHRFDGPCPEALRSHLPRVYHSDFAARTSFLVLEPMHQTLADWRASTSFQKASAEARLGLILEMAAQLLSAVAHCSNSFIAHKDIKPGKQKQISFRHGHNKRS